MRSYFNFGLRYALCDTMDSLEPHRSLSFDEWQ